MEGRHKADKQPHGSVGKKKKQGRPKYQKKDTLGFGQHPKERDGKKKEEKLCYSDSALRKGGRTS